MIVYKSNGATVGDGMRVTRVSGGGTRFEVLVDAKDGRFAEVTLKGSETEPRPDPEPTPQPVDKIAALKASAPVWRDGFSTWEPQPMPLNAEVHEGKTFSELFYVGDDARFLRPGWIFRNCVFEQSFRIMAGHNFLFEDCVFLKGSVMMATESFVASGIQNVQFKRCVWKDIWRDKPAEVTADGKWSPHSSRTSGAYWEGIRGLLFEDCLTDQCGWHPDALPDGSADGPQPASMYSHGHYVHQSCRDVIARRSVFRNNASHGFMMRSGGTIEDCLFIGNNIALSASTGDGAQQSVLSGNVIYGAGNNTPLAPQVGAVGWGIVCEAPNILAGNIVTHSGPINHSPSAVSAPTAHYDDTIVHKWGTVADKNVIGNPSLPLEVPFNRADWIAERARIMNQVRTAYGIA